MSHSTPQLPLFKVCINCGQFKPTSDFSRNRNSKDGFNSYCKPCASIRYKAWREKNKSRVQNYMRKWHDENREHETRYARERYRRDETHRRQVLEWDRQYRNRNREQVNERDKRRMQAKGFRNDQVRARAAISRTIRRGLLPPAWTMVCEICQEAQAQNWHHHNGYDRQHWLDVQALCADCHGRVHWSD